LGLISSEGHRGWRFGEFLLDEDRVALLRQGEEISLRSKSFEVLLLLVAHQGILVTREELLTAVWPNVVVSDDSLTQCLIDIRRALGDHERTLIRTVTGRGFIFEPSVERVRRRDSRPVRRAGRGPHGSLWLLGALLLGGIAVGWLSMSRSVEPKTPAAGTDTAAYNPGDQSIAVLTFEDLSAEADHLWFAEGVSEEIRNLLAKIPELRVIGRSSSSTFANRGEDLRVIGRTLGVRHVLEGSVRNTAGSVRISVQLVNTADGSMIWSDSYSENMSDIFALQDKVAAAVLDELKIHIGTYPTRGRPTKSSEAYVLFLKAMLALNVQDGLEAEALLLEAVQLDPDFAEAWELLAHTYWTEPDRLLSAMETRRRIRDAAGKALAIDPGQDFARAMYYESGGDGHALPEAIEAYILAAENQRNNSAVLRTLSWHLILAGYQNEALQLTERWIDLDPFSPMAYIRYGSALQAVGRGVESFAALEVAHRLGNNYIDWYLGESCLHSGQFQRATGFFETALEKDGAADTGWVKEFVTELTSTDSAAGYLDENIPTVVATLPPEMAESMEPNLNRWYLFFDELDRYYEILLDANPGTLWNTEYEYYFWYGAIYHRDGFTAHPRYLEAAQRLGLPEIWETHGAPDYCNKIADSWVCE
jgi:adenylate cyclase